MIQQRNSKDIDRLATKLYTPGSFARFSIPELLKLEKIFRKKQKMCAFLGRAA